MRFYNISLFYKWKRQKLKVTMLAVLRLKQVHDSVVLKGPTLFHPGNQRTMFPLGWGGTLSISSWLSCILDKVHSQRKVLELSPLLVATAWNQAEVNLQSEPLAAPESARYWGPSLHGSQSFLHIVGAKVPSSLLFQIILSRILM